jgi:hypothetical protein
MKTAVIERDGDAVRYNPGLLALADHYGFEPIACRPYRPNEKGSVERRVRDLRSSLLEGREFTRLADYRNAFERWRAETLGPRVFDKATGQTVAERARQEQPMLRALASNVFGEFPVKPVAIPKQPWFTYDTNRYSVPPSYVRRTLSLLATHDNVCVFDGKVMVARHARCWDKHTQIDDQVHIEALRQQRKRAIEHDGRKRLLQACPAAEALLARLVADNEYTAPHTRKLNQLIDQFGAEKVAGAIEDALNRNTPRSESVAMILRKSQLVIPTTPPPIPVQLPNHPDLDNQPFRHPNLEVYDACNTPSARRSR